ncbi:beta-glucosidase [Enterococcus sp. AZ103]|uniref:beta-glucosidase n=1 Tax=Enterococcus sp. AZ103 TaxID=2774628 RepID=UPI003F275399
MKKKIKDIIPQMSLKEKADFVCGQDFWHTKSLPAAEVPAVLLADGPNGLRIQEDATDHLGINDSKAATCFPTAASYSCSFDPELTALLGDTIANEALAEKVGLLLGPGINIKRNPLGGRNFEYLSEDPYLTSQLTIPLVKALQAKGVGACIKHFAANSQETARLINNSVIDERALAEIYLPQFEAVIKESQPWGVMTSYNRLNGIYTSESQELLQEKLRKNWNYQGMVVSDWGGTSDRVATLLAGMDLEMPYQDEANAEKIIAAVESGELPIEKLDTAVTAILTFVKKTQQNIHQSTFTEGQQHQIARKIAEESAVLLKNQDDHLPLTNFNQTAVVGALAKTPRFQGSGSSKINPTRLDCPIDFITGNDVTYSQGYQLDSEELFEEGLLAEALENAVKADNIVIFAGLPDSFEGEGYDRQHLDLPQNQNYLIEKIAEVNSNITVILMGGGPVILPWAEKVKSILLTYLAGQAVGSAVANLLTGKANPSGKLAETWPKKYSDTPSALTFAKDVKNSQYRESIYVGYRFYDTNKREVAYPFGFGLSYSQFKVATPEIEKVNNNIQVTVEIENTSSIAGAEVLQVYVGGSKKIPTAEKTLKAFQKVHLTAGEKKSIHFELQRDDFAYFDVSEKKWQVVEDQYTIYLANSSRNILAEMQLALSAVTDVKIPGEKIHPSNHSNEHPFAITEKDFAELFPAEKMPTMAASQKLTVDSTLADVKTVGGEMIYQSLISNLEQAIGGDPALYQMLMASIETMPLRSFKLAGAVSEDDLTQLLKQLNQEE